MKSTFDYESKSSDANPDPVMFYGEMVYPFMFDDYEELKPLKEVAEDLAKRKDWSALYGTGECKPRTNAAAAIYLDDMYVDRNLSFTCLDDGNKLDFVKPFITNEYQHSGLRDAGGLIFGKLQELAKE